MAKEKYSIDGQEGKEPSVRLRPDELLEYAAGLFGDSPENLKSLINDNLIIEYNIINKTDS